jgi:hypothetical protein
LGGGNENQNHNERMGEGMTDELEHAIKFFLFSAGVLMLSAAARIWFGI